MFDYPSVVIIFNMLILIAVAVVIVVAVRQAQKRRKEWQAFAASRGWRYIHLDRNFFREWRQEPFGRGSSRRATDIVEGTYHGVPFRGFTYQYTVSSGKSSTTYHHRVLQIPTAAVHLPMMQIRSGRRLALTKDIQFESDNFNDAFDVRGLDKRFVFKIVHPQFMAALLDGALGQYHYSIENGVFTLWERQRLSPYEVDEMAARLTHLLALVPSHVWADARVAPPPLDPGRGPGPASPHFSIAAPQHG
ncbi:hypothetical protein [Enemella sp. A6]|uniref:hypothetical protein n=1 Tax=Enemella sp. A6 TaxID=3440152 RepID=UPI003EC05210